MGGRCAWAGGMMIASTGEFERSEVQVLGQFDEEMVGVAFEEFGIGVVAQPQDTIGCDQNQLISNRST
jgi:hypothetical protein